MTGAPASGPRDDGLAFFGAITASLSHQINNALTIVAELNGLAEDLLAASSDERPVPADRLATVTQRIAGNLDRGTEYLRVLNRFAHSADHADTEADIAGLIGLLAQINRRFFDLKKASLDVTLGDAAGVLRTSPFHLLRALSRGLQEALSAGGEGCAVRLTVASEPTRILVTMAVSGAPPGRVLPAEQSAGLRLVCDRVGVLVDTGHQDGALCVQFAIPRERGQSMEWDQR